MALDVTRVRHPKAGEAVVPTRSLAHYEAKGWKPVKATKSTADRPANPAPSGADTASTKEGSDK